MMRCPQCGIRLSQAAPACRVHGAAPSIPVPLEPIASWFEERALRAALSAAGFRLIGQLGEGGFGAVFAVERLADKRLLALKLTRETGDAPRSELHHEAAHLTRAGAGLAPQLHGQGELVLPGSGAHAYLLMDHVAAPSLADRLVAAAPLSLAGFASLARPLLAAVAALHARGVVHRDLKPENVFVGDDGRISLIDFGLARERGAPSQSGPGAGRDVGTAEYMSPEQCVGDDAGDVRSDVYSLGIILYEALAGAPPFWGAAAEVREQHQSRRPQPLTRRGAPQGLDGAVRTSLAKHREERYPDVASFAAALDAALAEAHGAQERPTQLPQGEARAVSRREAVREKRRVGLLFAASTAPVVEIQACLAAFGGKLVQYAGGALVAAFGHDAADHPVQLAFNAALALRSRRLSERVLVDVGEVSLQRRRDGETRFFGAVLSDKARIPGPRVPHGVLFTQAAADTLPDMRFNALEGQADRLAIVRRELEDEATTFGLDRPTLVGRDGELTRLAALCEASADARPSLVTVVGQAGYGKSHLSRELALFLLRSARPPQVVRLSVREGVAGGASQAFPELLRRVLGLEEDGAPDGLRARLAERLSAAERERGMSAVLFMLGLLDAEDPEVQRLSAAPSALRFSAARALGELIRASARERPLALVIDDAHLADEACLDALEYATLAEGGAPLCVVVFVRPSFAAARPVWSARAGAADTLTLAALDVAAATDLARRLLFPVEYVPPQALSRLVERTQGIPRLMVELVRGLKRDGIVRRVERGTAFFLATDELDRLPDLPIVQWNAQREVEALPAELQAHAKLCALLGNGFGLPELEALLDAVESDDASAAVALDAKVGVVRLVRAGLLVRHRNGELAFRHPLLRDTLYAALSPAEQRRGHQLALGIYRSLKLPEGYALPRIALHAAASGEADVAADAYLVLGRRAAKVHSYLEAESAFGHALAALGARADERAVEAARGRGLMRTRLGRHEDALRDLRTARERAGHSAIALELYLDEAMVLDWLRQFAAAEQCVVEVERAAPEPGSLLYARLLAATARSAHRRTDSEGCIRDGLRAAELARSFGDAGYETRLIALLMVAPDCAFLGRLDQAERYFADAIREAEAHSDMIHLTVAHINRVVLSYAARDGEKAVHDLSRAISLAREFGEPLFEYSALNNLGEIEFARDQVARARDFAERGLALAMRLWGDGSREVLTEQLLLARVELYDGHFEAAAAWTQKARAIVSAAAGTHTCDLTKGEDLQLRMLELSLGEASDAGWEALVAELAGADVTPQDELELLEGHARWAFRVGLFERAQVLAQRAVVAARERPNLLGERVLRRHDMGGPAEAAAPS